MEKIKTFISNKIRDRSKNGLVIVSDKKATQELLIKCCKELNLSFSVLSNNDAIQIAEENRYLIMQDYNIMEYKILRPWNRGGLIADILPLFN